MTEITYQTEPYNDRRYCKPYIALCDENAKADSWGTWLGSDGYAGELTLEVPAEPRIVMRGQKDNRGGNSAPFFAVVVNGEIVEIEEGKKWTANKIRAVELLRQVKQDTDPKAALAAERARLVARIAEIDAELAK